MNLAKTRVNFLGLYVKDRTYQKICELHNLGLMDIKYA